MASTPNFPFEFNTGFAQIVNADASDLKTILTAGSNGTTLLGVSASSDDTSDRVVQIGITRGGSFTLLGAITVPDLSGTDGTNVSVNLFNATSIPGLVLDSDGQRYWALESGDTLQVRATTTVTSAKTINISALGKDL